MIHMFIRLEQLTWLTEWWVEGVVDMITISAKFRLGSSNQRSSRSKVTKSSTKGKSLSKRETPLNHMQDQTPK